MTRHYSETDPERWEAIIELSDELAAKGYSFTGACAVINERIGVPWTTLNNWRHDGRLPKFKTQPNHIKGRSPDDWAEIERRIAEAALNNCSLAKARSDIREFGVSTVTLNEWVRKGLITSYKPASNMSKGNLKYAPQMDEARAVLARSR